MSRISFEILNFLTASINFWKKSQCSWITPIYSDFSKIWCWKILLCNNQFPWYAKVRENRLFRQRWLKLEYSISQTLLLSIKIFQLLIYFALWEIPQDASQREGNQSLQNKSTYKALKSNFQIESSTRNQKFSKRRTPRNTILKHNTQ